MRGFFRRAVAPTMLLVLVVACAVVARVAHADLIFFSDNPSGFNKLLKDEEIDQENVKFNKDGLLLSGSTIEGYVNNTDFQRLSISSSTELSGNGPPGQSVTAPGGGFFDATFIPHLDNLEDFGGFRSLSFNIDATNDEGEVVAEVYGSEDELIQTYQFDLSKGQNFFGVVATGKEIFTRVQIAPPPVDVTANDQLKPTTAQDYFDRIAQIRAGFSSAGTSDGGGGGDGGGGDGGGGGGGGGGDGGMMTPEPASVAVWIALGGVFGLCVWYRRRRLSVRACSPRA